jgi:hypothetical protein
MDERFVFPTKRAIISTWQYRVVQRNEGQCGYKLRIKSARLIHLYSGGGGHYKR